MRHTAQIALGKEECGTKVIQTEKQNKTTTHTHTHKRERILKQKEN